MVSMKVTVMVATLAALCVLATNTHAAYRFCCRRYFPGKIPLSEIKGFSLQKNTELCPFRAIIFHTNTRKTCADPTKKWVMDYVTQIDAMAKKMSIAKWKEQEENVLWA
ncbi:C-C motif chemokine 20a.3 isoform X2 [Poeciliopsis prolifica]|uniref:C-C motif chemokine 20a.3 isoform X2 n=1 Tax=Poeciliopsis prolifica TaxID=188132 RepID=UPI0024130E04|nr:C-C motif chemokine 20a.3 isoform X2 [Poeciliopsis prolifica]